MFTNLLIAQTGESNALSGTQWMFLGLILLAGVALVAVVFRMKN